MFASLIVSPLASDLLLHKYLLACGRNDGMGRDLKCLDIRGDDNAK